MKNLTIRRYLRHGTLVQLSVLDSVVRTGSFTSAGQELHMAQPTVSMHMKKLTEAVGLPLFESGGRTPKLTEAGRELHACCQDIFDKIIDVESRLAKMRGSSSARIRLAVSTTGKYFAPRLLAHFWEDFPGVEVALSLMNRQQLLHRIEGDLDDFYVLSNPPEDIELVTHPILPNNLYIYAHESHPLASRGQIQLKDLAKERFLLREPGSGNRLAVDEAFASQGFSPLPGLELVSNEAIKQAILSNLGIAVLSHNSLAMETRRGHIVALDVEGFPLKREWYLAYRKERKLSPSAKDFMQHALREDVLRELHEADAH